MLRDKGGNGPRPAARLLRRQPRLHLANPPITAIDLRPRKAGAACAELLYDLLAGASAPGTERIHPIELQIGSSTRVG
ncbi:substrate-binding domain-containing protein [Nonomuraea sp. M3C6]|uniref:Substrate-binding domain-containing protein n=1 Tax=Nonomuraea marmarensis TaxID=3351344 RepID=A0ABW7AY18_9ACTN